MVRTVTSDCLTGDDQTDYFPDKIPAAEQGLDFGFTLEYHNTYKIVTNLKTKEVYVLYCSSTKPNNTNIPNTAKAFIQIPVKNVAGLENSTVSFLEILGVQSTLKYVTNNATIVSPCLQKNNSIESFGLNITNVDVVFTDGTSLNSGKDVSVSIDDDLSPIRKSEWIKFISSFYNLEKTALNSLNALKIIYACNKNNLANIPNDKKKQIAWVAYNNDTNQYSATTLDITKTSATSSIQDFQKIIASAHIVIDQTKLVYPNDKYEYWSKLFGYYNLNPNDKENPPPYFIKNKLVFRTSKTKNALGFSDWNERSSSRPDIAIQDLIAVQYPTYQPNYKITWLERFFDSVSGNIITKENCTTDLENASTLPISDFAVSILAGLAGFGVAIWLFIFGRRKYRERFVELKDEPEIQLSDVKDVK
nr:12588_t:CDS:2 [Entrophospora candida]